MRHLIQQLQKHRFLSPVLCFASLLFLDISFRWIYSFVGSTPVWDAQPFNFTVGWSLLLTALVMLLPRLLRRIAMVLLIVFFSLLVVVHGAMYNIFGNFFTFSDLNFAEDGARFFSWSYLNFRKLFLICIFAAVLLMVAAAILVPPKKPGKAGGNLVWCPWELLCLQSIPSCILTTPPFPSLTPCGGATPMTPPLLVKSIKILLIAIAP